jgi:hypothetical protein
MLSGAEIAESRSDGQVIGANLWARNASVCCMASDFRLMALAEATIQMPVGALVLH